MKILLVCNYRKGVGGISGQVELLQRGLTAEGITADIFSTKGSVLRRLSLLRRLMRRSKDYDVLHIHCCSSWGFLPAVVGVHCGKRLGKRTVVTYHGGGAERFFAKHERLVRHYLCKSDCNIVLSGFLAEIFERHEIPCTIIPNIIAMGEGQFRLRERLLPRYICIRSHEPLYNVPCILRAFQRVQKQLPEASLTLVGDGSQHKELMQMVDSMMLNNITFTGRVDNGAIYGQLDKADIMLSAPTVDNMPVSLIEGMNAGLLVISSRVGGVPFMVKNGGNGLLFESDNDRELAERMLWAVSNQTLAKALILQARKTADKYQWGHIKDLIHKAYGISA